MFEKLKLYRTPLLLAVISIGFYISFAYDLERSDFVKLITLYCGLFFLFYKLVKITKGSFWLLAAFGVIFRLLFLGAIPNLSQDFFRFLWDGRLIVGGVNPYLFTPDSLLNGLVTAEAPIAQASALHTGMGPLSAGHYSNYPPLNQLLFAIVAVFAGKSILGSVIALRLIIILADIGILYYGKKLLMRLEIPTHRIFWYFLNPFIIIELTGNLHFEGALLCFLIASLYYLHIKRWIRSAVLFACSISVKLLPLMLLPVFYRYFTNTKEALGTKTLLKYYGIVIAVTLLAFTPFLSIDFISNYFNTLGLWFQKFEFNASIYYLIRWIGFEAVGWNIIALAGKILPLTVIICILLISFFRKNNTTPRLITSLLFGVTVYFLLATTVHPWYLATPLLLSVFTNYRFPLVWSLMVMLSYSAYGATGFSENLWLVALEYLAVLGFLGWELFGTNKLSKNNNR